MIHQSCTMFRARVSRVPHNPPVGSLKKDHLHKSQAQGSKGGPNSSEASTWTGHYTRRLRNVCTSDDTWQYMHAHLHVCAAVVNI